MMKTTWNVSELNVPISLADLVARPYIFLVLYIVCSGHQMQKAAAGTAMQALLSRP